jgi:versiconal hemiacetal acetate reductase
MAAWEFQTLQNIAARNGWHQFISMQNYYNLITRDEEREMIPYCLDSGVGLIPWAPLAQGVLARPRKTDASGTLRGSTDEFQNALIRSRQTEADEMIIDRIEEVANRKGISMAQVAIAWLLTRPSVSPILGFTRKEWIDEAITSLKVELTPEEIAYLEQPYQPKPIFILAER